MILDQLDKLWTQIIDLTSKLVIPDWGSLIGLLPIFVIILVIGPVVTIGILGWLVYVVRRPRANIRIADGPTLAEVSEDGDVLFPVGLPYCTRDRLVYASGATRCRDCGNDLSVICPMCGLGRSAGITTCGNCGLVLKVEDRVRVLRPSGPPPGGAAIA